MEFALKRLIGGIAVLFITSLVAFSILHLLPADPVRMMLGSLASEEAVASQRHALGLDQPILVQYYRYVTEFVRGDWGIAFTTGRPVRVELGARLPATIELALFSLLAALVACFSLGIIAVLFKGRWIDGLLRAVSLAALGVPSFWLGLVLLVVFFFYLRLLPAPTGRLALTTIPPPETTGLYTIDAALAGQWGVVREAVSYLVLPVCTLAFAIFPYLFRMFRASLLEALNERYITVAHGKGLSNLQVLTRHALPNALLPTLTSAALTFGGLLTGVVLIETVFLWPGVGGFVTAAVLSNDYASVEVVILLSAAVYTVVNIGVDLLYGFLNPRTRRS